VVQELYRHHPELTATLILVDTYAGWMGSLPEEEIRARVAGVRQILAAPARGFDSTLPEMFAGDPPSSTCGYWRRWPQTSARRACRPRCV
jgi:hypothetical protein